MLNEDFNKKVFETFPDSLWTGDIPALGEKTARKTVFSSPVFAFAAACLLFGVVFLFLPRKNEPQVPVSTARSEIVYKVNDAVQASFVLPDSTLVTLNSGSTLRLAEDFGSLTRTVMLDGEALFDVRHDKGIPFIVNTPQGVEVKVTGTQFDLNCYSDNELFYLTLFKGSVEVTTIKKEVIHVSPSEQLIIKDEFLNLSAKEEPREAMEWTEGVLRFNNTPLKEAFARIEKWYGVDVQALDGSVYHNTITAEFRSEPLEDVLRLICIASRLQYTITDKTVSVKSK